MEQRILRIIIVIILIFPCYVKGQEINIHCFAYHRFGDSRYPSTNISEEAFERHLKYLYNNDYEVVTLSDAVDRLSKGGKAQKIAVLTVDDGYSSFVESGLPILEKYGYKATIFVNTSQVGKPDFIDWEGLQNLAEAGIEIGNHGNKHEHFLDYNEEQTKEAFSKDLLESEELFRDHLGFVPSTYAYPYGEYSQSMKEILISRGYQAAVVQHSGVISEHSDLYEFPRFPVAGNYAEIEGFISKAGTKALPVKDITPSSVEIHSFRFPEFTLKLLDSNLVDIERIQCFRSDGLECEAVYEEATGLIRVLSKEDLGQRRTKVTLTAPSSGGNNAWHWYSRLMVLTSIKE